MQDTNLQGLELSTPERMVRGFIVESWIMVVIAPQLDSMCYHRPFQSRIGAEEDRDLQA